MGHAIVSGGARASAPVVGIRLGDIAEGQLVKLLENGTAVEFYVAKHDYESGLNGAGRTLLVRKDCYDERVWNNSNVNAYATSAIDTWLNGTYKAFLDSITQELIGETSFYYTPGNGVYTVSTLTRSVFLLSLAELNWVSSDFNAEGSSLPIALVLQEAHYNGSSVNFWTRSPRNNSAYYAGFIGGYAHCSIEMGSRPCFTLPSGACFDEETMLFNGKVVV